MDRFAHISRAKFYHYIIIFPIFIIIRLWQLSIRFRSDADSVKVMRSPERMLGLAWHNRIFFLPIARYRYRSAYPMAGLISSSRDGAYLAALFSFMRIGAIRGSSKHRGGFAILNLIDAIKGGSDVFITPDGPKGPKYKAKSGFLTVAKESGVRILLLNIKPKAYWSFKSWDGFIVPKPFSSVDIKALNIENYDALLKAAKESNVSAEEFVTNYMNS